MVWKARAALVVLMLMLPGPVRADGVADFYRGRIISLVIGYAAIE
jgi:hypothetical protein